mmetsp:Transcript_33210/g.87828  ORF Transcript_33210/g.87828 Transcript_33210/m.87828 type:complete len:235 (+) Transcript_33210:4215-4919(+)
MPASPTWRPASLASPSGRPSSPRRPLPSKRTWPSGRIASPLWASLRGTLGRASSRSLRAPPPCAPLSRMLRSWPGISSRVRLLPWCFLLRIPRFRACDRSIKNLQTPPGTSLRSSRCSPAIGGVSRASAWSTPASRTSWPRARRSRRRCGPSMRRRATRRGSGAAATAAFRRTRGEPRTKGGCARWTAPSQRPPPNGWSARGWPSAWTARSTVATRSCPPRTPTCTLGLASRWP